MKRKSFKQRALAITLMWIISRLWIPCFAEGDTPSTLGDSGNAIVQSSYQIGEFDSSHAGTEMLISILIYNPNESSFYDMINMGFNGNPLTESLGDNNANWTTIYGANPGDPINLAGNGESVAYQDLLQIDILSYVTEAAFTGEMSITGAGDNLGSYDYGTFSIWEPIPKAAPGIGAINTVMNTASNSLHVSDLGICTTNFLSAHTNTTFQIATTTNLTSGAWTTNSTLHSITGAVTTVSITNTAPRAFFKIIAE